jgi:hypothetical protein
MQLPKMQLKPKRIEPKTGQLLHVSTPFGRIMLGLVRGETLPESTRNLPQGLIDDRLASL